MSVTARRSIMVPSRHRAVERAQQPRADNVLDVVDPARDGIQGRARGTARRYQRGSTRNRGPAMPALHSATTVQTSLAASLDLLTGTC
ncbi:hypothetical protein O4220_27145 [Rhodococcus ruber]|uniref:Uncharacterized protein n=1 Tax=Rhodococcus ruber TaxID=1830 RepID=A0ABT4MMJ1_9NOCA|nr:hypothetical protein [Rhodococcus ruber]MCZ4522216.1 hypothetical protein [Rhodococcus ruber]